MYKAKNKKSIFNSEFNNKKLPGVDIAKFFFSICIIALHTEVVGTDNFVCFLITKLVFRIAVPFFFVASGFFLEIKIEKSNDVKYAIKSYCIRLLRPLLFFTAINYVEQIVSMVKLGFGPRTIIIQLLSSTLFYPYGALWYVQASIVGALILVPFLKSRKLGLAIICGDFLYCFALLCNNYYGFISNEKIKSIVDFYLMHCISARNGFFVGFVFIAIGLLIGKKRNTIYNIHSVYSSAVFLVLYLLYFIEVILIKKNGLVADDGSLYIMSLFIAPALFCVVAEIKIDERRWLYMNSVLLRKLSVGMYFLHRPILWIVSNISNDEMMNFTLTTAICASICLLSYRKPNSFLCKMLQ